MSFHGRVNMDQATIAALVESYKIGTRQVAQWLVKSARGHISSRRLAAAVELAAAQYGIAHSVQLESYDLVQLAEDIEEHVASSGRTPWDISIVLAVLHSTIRSRKGCAEWYKARGARTEEQLSLNESHQRFIDALTAVSNCLRRVQQAANGAAPQVKTASALAKLTGAPFTQLDLEEPGEIPDIPTVEVVEHAARIVTDGDIAANIIDEPDDSAFAIAGILAECYDMRQFLRAV
ncbi:hypothetical protein CLAFUR4_08541 [Fulvia fulva]|nr:hypothetical protein CLAFUR4_08541 [Fulvia fulva]WPV27686.1 hypothetical protein CLAFUW7_08536 [Fulvia fulva]